MAAEKVAESPDTVVVGDTMVTELTCSQQDFVQGGLTGT
jgi:hypothetical protein